MQTIYNIDYLESISKEKLWNLAKQNPNFREATMERILQMPHNTVRKSITSKQSKYEQQIKKYLIDFLAPKSSSKIKPESDLSLNDLFQEAKKYQKVTIAKIAEEIGCPMSTVFNHLHRKDKSNERVSYLMKEYLETIISKNKALESKFYTSKPNYTEELTDEYSTKLNLKSCTVRKLYEEARKYSVFSLANMAKDTGISYNSIHSSMNSLNSKYTNIIRNYLIDFLYNVNENSSGLAELFNEANKYEKVTDAEIARALQISPSTVLYHRGIGKNGGKAAPIKEYLENIINKHKSRHTIISEMNGEKQMTNGLNLEELFIEANKYQRITNKQIAEDLGCDVTTVSSSKTGKSKGKTAYRIKEYLEDIIKQYKPLNEEMQEQYSAQEEDNLNLDSLFKEASSTNKEVAEALNISLSTVSLSRQGKTKGEAAYKIKAYLEEIIEQNRQVDELFAEIDKVAQEEVKEQETMTEETLTDTKEMKTYDEFLNFVNTQKELPIVKKALDETLSENQNLDKILTKEEFITIETAQELNEKIFANEYTEAEILDFENQYYGTVNDDSLKDKIKAFVEKHNLSLETALKLLQISEEDYKKMLEGADKVSNKTADKIYKAITAFDEFYHSEKTQDTINNTKNTFVTGVAIASAKGQTFLNKGLNKFADFLNKSADKIKNSNSDNKDE